MKCRYAVSYSFRRGNRDGRTDFKVNELGTKKRLSYDHKSRLEFEER
jgi:hypothetical protein